MRERYVWRCAEQRRIVIAESHESHPVNGDREELDLRCHGNTNPIRVWLCGCIGVRVFMRVWVCVCACVLSKGMVIYRWMLQCRPELAEAGLQQQERV